MRPVIPYVTAALLFGLGSYGVLRRRNAILVLMSVELMLNAVNLLLVTADSTARAALPHSGQVFALFVIVIAAAEVGVGLAIVLQLYRLRGSVDTDEVPLDGHPPDAGPTPAVNPPAGPTPGGPSSAGSPGGPSSTGPSAGGPPPSSAVAAP